MRATGEPHQEVCEVELRGNAALVRISGSLDAGCARRVERVLRRVVKGGLARIVIDLRYLGRLDEEGIDVLVSALARAEHAGTEVALIHPHGAVQRAGAVRAPAQVPALA